ncbi:hypothetical protein D3C71_1417340 [compost metagenome]
MNTDPVEGQEADFTRFVRRGDIKNPQPRAPAFVLHVADGVPHLAGVVDLFVGKTGVGKQIAGIDHQQQIVMRLEMHIPGTRRRRHIARRFWIFRVAHVDDGKALRHHMADIGKTTMHHQLHAVRATALIAVTNQPHIAGVVGAR